MTRIPPGHEDRLAVLALGRTAAFFICSIPLLFLSFLLASGTPLPTIIPLSEDALALAIFLMLEVALLVLISKGLVPGTNPVVVEAVPESAIAGIFTIASAVTWLLAGSGEVGRLIQLVFSWSLLISVCVYFVAKSVAAGRPRWRVLLVGVLPAMQVGLALN